MLRRLYFMIAVSVLAGILTVPCFSAEDARAMLTESEKQAIAGPVGQETDSATLGPLKTGIGGSVIIDFGALIDSGELPTSTIITESICQ